MTERVRGSRSRSTASYAPWLVRVLAWIIDSIPVVVLLAIGFGLLLQTRRTDCSSDSTGFDVGDFCTTGASTLGQVGLGAAVVGVLAYCAWNNGYRQGVTGSSIGKSIMSVKVVGENTGQPIGFGLSIVRQLAHGVDAIVCYIGFFFPIWDAKRQTFADKIMSTICVRAA